MEIITHIAASFQQNENPSKAVEMAAYLKDQFPFFGLPRDQRWPHYRSAWAAHPIGNSDELEAVIRTAWSQPQREFHYFAIETVIKYKKLLQADHLSLIHHCITHQSWWDTVDMFAGRISGYFFQQFPNLIPKGPDQWIGSDNLWLIRSALLNQLFFDMDHFDEQRLFRYILQHKANKEFFIAKAIGWALRQYSKQRPERVRWFLDHTELQPLSRKEAAKRLI
ncbi:MAG: DNA alkylation repair protein [Cyclobacteriaceae bacterium]